MKAEENPTDSLALAYGAITARLWLAVRAIQTGVEKFAGTAVSETAVQIDGQANSYGLTDAAATKGYALSNYHGVPAALYEKFSSEPLMPAWGLKIYDKALGPLLLVLGFTILLGVASRTSLFALGLLYTSLTWGLILLGEPGNAGVAWLAAHMILIVMALCLVRYDRFRILKKW